MKNYQKQNGCHNCQHCFIFREYEEGSSFYCTFNAPPRPLCGSVAMGESFFKDSLNMETLTEEDAEKEWQRRDAEFDKRLDEWTAWSKDRHVESFGICDNHERKTL
jgi:hypothetical protein